MSFRRDNKTKTNYSKISIGLASPEEILDLLGRIGTPVRILFEESDCV